MNVYLLEEAEEELKEAVASYEATDAGLGVRLKAEARGVLQWIHQYPELPRVRPKGYRRVNLRVFPYYVAYFIWAEKIWVLSFAPSRRRPEYWIRRKRRVED